MPLLLAEPFLRSFQTCATALGSNFKKRAGSKHDGSRTPCPAATSMNPFLSEATRSKGIASNKSITTSSFASNKDATTSKEHRY